jgi:hypothetical protein
MRVEARLEELGLRLPPLTRQTPGVLLPVGRVRLHGDRVYLTGHCTLTDRGDPAGPFGEVGTEVSVVEARLAARGAAMALLARLKQTLGDLDRVDAWLQVRGAVRCATGFAQLGDVIEGCSETILDAFGATVGGHALAVTGVAALPLNLAVVVDAEVAVRPAEQEAIPGGRTAASGDGGAPSHPV